MENSKSSMIIGVVVVILVGLGIFWAMNSGDDTETVNNDSSSQTEQTTQTQEQTTPDIVGLAAQTPTLSTLVTAVTAADLVETLQGAGPFTVFAPTNDAFGALPAGTLDTLLLPENVSQLASILTYHVVAGEVLAADLSDGQVVTTVQGDTLTVSIRDSGVYLTDTSGNEVMVETADVDASNGVVHIIGGVLLPS